MALIDEVAGLPQAGLTLRFPKSALSDPGLREDISLRNTVQSIQWDSELQQLTVLVRDAAFSAVSKRRLRLAFVLDLQKKDTSVRFIDHDRYLLELKRLIATGALVDAWGVMGSDRLVRYGDSLAQQVEMWDESQGGRWVPLDLEFVRRTLFGKKRSR